MLVSVAWIPVWFWFFIFSNMLWEIKDKLSEKSVPEVLGEHLLSHFPEVYCVVKYVLLNWGQKEVCKAAKQLRN